MWFYPGQTDIQHMLACRTVSASLAAGPKHHGTVGSHGHNGTQVALHKKNQAAVHMALSDLNTSSIAILNERLQKLIELHGVN